MPPKRSRKSPPPGSLPVTKRRSARLNPDSDSEHSHGPDALSLDDAFGRGSNGKKSKLVAQNPPVEVPARVTRTSSLRFEVSSSYSRRETPISGSKDRETGVQTAELETMVMNEEAISRDASIDSGTGEEDDVGPTADAFGANQQGSVNADKRPVDITENKLVSWPPAGYDFGRYAQLRGIAQTSKNKNGGKVEKSTAVAESAIPGRSLGKSKDGESTNTVFNKESDTNHQDNLTSTKNLEVALDERKWRPKIKLPAEYMFHGSGWGYDMASGIREVGFGPWESEYEAVKVIRGIKDEYKSISSYEEYLLVSANTAEPSLQRARDSLRIRDALRDLLSPVESEVYVWVKEYSRELKAVWVPERKTFNLGLMREECAKHKTYGCVCHLGIFLIEARESFVKKERWTMRYDIEQISKEKVMQVYLGAVEKQMNWDNGSSDGGISGASTQSEDTNLTIPRIYHSGVSAEGPPSTRSNVMGNGSGHLPLAQSHLISLEADPATHLNGLNNARPPRASQSNTAPARTMRGNIIIPHGTNGTDIEVSMDDIPPLEDTDTAHLPSYLRNLSGILIGLADKAAIDSSRATALESENTDLKSRNDKLCERVINLQRDILLQGEELRMTEEELKASKEVTNSGTHLDDRYLNSQSQPASTDAVGSHGEENAGAANGTTGSFPEVIEDSQGEEELF